MQQFNFLKQKLKRALDQTTSEEHHGNFPQYNDLDTMGNERKAESIAENIRIYLLWRQVQNINDLWETIIKTQNENAHNKYGEIRKHIESSKKQLISDLCLLEAVASVPFDEYFAEEMIQKNLRREVISLHDWVHIFNILNNNVPTNEISTQTDNPVNSSGEVGTQIFYSKTMEGVSHNSTQTESIKTVKIDSETQTICDEIVKNIPNNSTQTTLVEKFTQSATTQTSYAEIVKQGNNFIQNEKKLPQNKKNTTSTQISPKNNRVVPPKVGKITAKKNNAAQFFNVKTQNYFEKLTPPIEQTCENIKKPRQNNKEKFTSPFQRKIPVMHHSRRNQSVQKKGTMQKNEKNKMNNLNQRNHPDNNYSSSLQRQKWNQKREKPCGPQQKQNEGPKYKEKSFHRGNDYAMDRNRPKNKNNFNRHNQNIDNVFCLLSKLIFDVLNKHLYLNRNENNNYIKNNYDHKNMNNQRKKPYGKIFI